MSTEDLRFLDAALTGQENWLYADEVRQLHDLRRQVEIGWRLSVDQRESVMRMVERARERAGRSSRPMA